MFTTESSFNEFESFLGELNFEQFYATHVQHAHQEINYGKRKGSLRITGLRNAGEQYNYKDDPRYQVSINHQMTPSNDFVLQCIEVFDWGGVQPANIISALNLHHDGKLRAMFEHVKHELENDVKLHVTATNDDLVWSSGWTKVYSLFCDVTTIYDSRVAAYLNWMLFNFYETLSPTGKEKLAHITQFLYAFGGNNGRLRSLNKPALGALQIRSTSRGSDVEKIQANKLASWFLRVLTSYEFGDNYTQQDFRCVDKAFFMLGFDLSQLKYDELPSYAR